MSTHNICFYGELKKIIPELWLSSPLCNCFHFSIKAHTEQAHEKGSYGFQVRGFSNVYLQPLLGLKSCIFA